MPNTKSAAKELCKTKKRTAHNVRIKSNIKTLLKKIEKAVARGDKETVQTLTKQVQSLLDKSIKNNVLKKNTVARKKSRLFKRLNKAAK